MTKQQVLFGGRSRGDGSCGFPGPCSSQESWPKSGATLPQFLLTALREVEVARKATINAWATWCVKLRWQDLVLTCSHVNPRIPVVPQSEPATAGTPEAEPVVEATTAAPAAAVPEPRHSIPMLKGKKKNSKTSKRAMLRVEPGRSQTLGLRSYWTEVQTDEGRVTFTMAPSRDPQA